MRNTLTITLLLVTQALFAQYFFSFRNEPYVPINGTIISPDTAWETINIPFTLEFPVRYSGRIFEGGTISERNLFLFDEDQACMAAPFYHPGSYLTDAHYRGDGIKRSAGSEVSHITTGVPGDRIFKVQFKDLKFTETTYKDTVNFQIWLYEKDNAVEYHYGRIKINTPSVFTEYPPGIIPLFQDDFYQHVMVVSGDPAGPVMTEISFEEFDVETMPYLTSFPHEGLVLRFADFPSGVTDHEGTTLTVYPNPARTTLRVNNGMGQALTDVVIINTLGQEMKVKINPRGNIDVSTLRPGVYFIRGASHNYTVRFIKE